MSDIDPIHQMCAPIGEGVCERQESIRFQLRTGEETDSKRYDCLNVPTKLHQACGGARLAGRRRRTRERVRGMSEVAKLPSESVGEGVAENGARVSRSSVHTATNTHV